MRPARWLLLPLVLAVPLAAEQAPALLAWLRAWRQPLYLTIGVACVLLSLGVGIKRMAEERRRR